MPAKRRSTEATKLLADLDRELEEAGIDAGEPLFWTAADEQTRKSIASAVDRRLTTARDYGEAKSASARMSLSAELRYLEAHIAKLLMQLRDEIPTPSAGQPETEPVSQASARAKRAADARWSRSR